LFKSCKSWKNIRRERKNIKKKETLCTYKLKVQIYQTSIGKVWIETLINIKNKKNKKEEKKMLWRFSEDPRTILFLFSCRLSAAVASYSFSRIAVAGLSNRVFVPCSEESSRHVVLCRIIIYYIIQIFIAIIADAFVLVNNLLSSDWQTHTYITHIRLIHPSHCSESDL